MPNFSLVPFAVARRVPTWRLLSSVIVDATSTVLEGPLVRERGMLITDVDLDSLLARKRWFDAAGHYNRPDVFRLTVDERPKPAVNLETLID